MPRLSDEELLRKLLASSERTTARYNGVPCLEWWGFCHKGYGRVRDGKDKRRVHSAAWRLMYGEPPQGHGVLHHCDNPPCWEPSHLWTGTPLANIRDCIDKGRSKTDSHRKLTPEQVREIRRRLLSGEPKRALGGAFGVTEANIRAIATGRSWSWLA